jgi:hypothetical protein
MSKTMGYLAMANCTGQDQPQICHPIKVSMQALVVDVQDDVWSNACMCVQWSTNSAKIDLRCHIPYNGRRVKGASQFH